MSEVDNRIVQMQFDNKQFENNIKTSTQSLENLKKGLNLEEAAQHLSNLDKAGRSFSLQGIAAGVDTIASKFNALSIIGITALANIANSAVNAGKSLVSSLTIDPVKTGLEEYETKMNAITTILTNTKSKGTTLDDVNKALNELNTYADQTIYNFSEMTRNIGTFTAAGVDLKTATESIKGIANLAAGSGSSAAQASTAMYQLSQAMATGTVKLMDWNSVVNAGMGGELFQKALENTAKQLGHGRSMAISFRDSLDTGWLTTEVLTKTLQKFAKDPSLLQAATQVKTLTQMLDTMKESVQSGWAQTWETIIGNKDEAAKLFTSINDGFNAIVGSSANARNKMLAFWKVNGGRDAAIGGLSNAFKGLQSILVLVHDAFTEIFPPMTGERLVAITKGFKDLTDNIKIEGNFAYNLHQTFKGLFAILDIGVQAVTAIGKGVLSLVNYLLPAGDGILSFTGSLGGWIAALDESIRKAGTFNVVIEKLGNFLKPIGEAVKKSISDISDAFKSFAKIDMSGFDSFSNNVKQKFEPLTALGELFKSVFNGMARVVEKVSPVFFALGTLVGKTFEQIGKTISNAVTNGDYNTTIDLLNSGLFVGIILGLKKIIESLSDITDTAGGFVKNVTGILDGVRGSLSAYQSSLKANTLLTIAIAIGILSASLLVLAGIDSAKLAASLTAMSGLFLELFGSMGVFEKVIGSKGFKGINGVTFSMISLSVAVLILSDAMTKLSKINFNGLVKGIVSIDLLMGMMTKSSQTLSANYKGLIRGSTGLVIFAGAIIVLTEAVKKLGGIKIEVLGKGLLGVGALLTELSLFLRMTDLGGIGMFKATGILILATAIVVLSEAVKKFSQINSTSLLKGLGAVAVLLGEISLFSTVNANNKSMIMASVGITILGAAMLIFAEAIKRMGSIPLEQIGKGLLSMAGALTIITLAMNFMPKDSILTGTGLVVIASALVILSGALKTMGDMTKKEIGKSLIELAGALGLISVAMALMQGALPGAAALLIISGALAILAPVLKSLGGMSLDDIGKSLLVLAGVFSILGVSALVLAPLVPAILGLAGAIVLLGIGIAAIGGGILAFSAGMTALAISGTAGAAALTLIFSSLLGLIPMAFQMLAKGIIEFANILSQAGPTLTSAATTFLDAIITAIIIETPKIILGLLNLIQTMLSNIDAAMPKMVESGMNIIIKFLQGVADKTQALVDAGIDIVVNFLNGVASKLQAVIDAAFKLIIAFINGLATAIRNNHNAIASAGTNLIGAMLDAFADLSGFNTVGRNIVNGLIGGMRSKITEAANWAGSLASTIISSAKKVLGIHSPSTEFASIGMYSVMGLANGLKKYSTLAVDASKNVGNRALDSLSNAMSVIPDVINGNIDMNPTIRPVIDLTDIQNGSKQINGLMSTFDSYSMMGTFNAANIAAAGFRNNQAALNSPSGDTITNEGANTKNIFYITGDDPKAIADEVARKLQNQVDRRDAVWD